VRADNRSIEEKKSHLGKFYITTLYQLPKIRSNKHCYRFYIMTKVFYEAFATIAFL